MKVEVIRAAALNAAPHGFLGRRGGVSIGEVAGLNTGLGSGDDKALIAENRARAVAAVMPGALLGTVFQIHSARVVRADAPWPDDNRPHADALVTDRPGLLLGILTADCAPVLLADAEGGVVGAAHAGWRGALGSVTNATVEAMEALGARRKRIVAAVGPCIGRASYEVDKAFFERFVSRDSENEHFFSDGPKDRPHFDLEAYVVARLAAAGVGRVEALSLDTYADPKRFYSYRRAMHRGEASYGRQISLIGIAGDNPRES